MLELGCGTGRVTELLAAHAQKVIAVDLSAVMLQKASYAVRKRNNVQLIQADIRSLGLKGQFDVVVASDDPLAHMIKGSGRDRTLRNVAGQLKGDGIFLFEPLWFSPEKRKQMCNRGYETEQVVETEQGEFQVCESWRGSKNSSFCRAEFVYLLNGEQLQKVEFKARLWEPEEIDLRLGNAGMRVSTAWGDYDRQPWNEKSSPTLILEVRRC